MILKCTQLALVEQLIGAGIANSASPGFVYGRGGNVPGNSWYLNNAVPSNITGVAFGLNNGKVLAVWAVSQNIHTYDIAVYEHLGDEIALTLLATVSIVAARTQIIVPTDAEFTHSADPSKDVQLGCRIINGSAKNPKCSLFLGGT